MHTSNTDQNKPVKTVEEELDKAALNAIKATNLCTKHMKYHGQETNDCTPEERILIEVKSNKEEK